MPIFLRKKLHNQTFVAIFAFYEKRLEMNLLKNFFVCLSVLCILSCQTDKSTTIKSVEINKEGIRSEGKPFTGTVWSEDSSTYCLEVKDGSLISYTLFHPNGTPAIKMTTDSTEMQFFDENGSVMSLESFVNDYGLLADEVTELAQIIDSRSSSE